MDVGPASPTIRRRKLERSLRRRDGLIAYARDVTSQNGEDGIIAKLVEVLGLHTNSDKRSCCVDVGAWDGVHLSNTHSLLTRQNWRGVLIEADSERFQQLLNLHEPLGNTCLSCRVSCHNKNLPQLLRSKAPWLPFNFEFLCIDVDGPDYWLLRDIWEDDYRPSIVCVEFNPTMPHDLIFVQNRDDAVRHGSSLAAMVELAFSHNYSLVETTLYNAFFVPTDVYDNNPELQRLVPDRSLEILHEVTMGTTLYQLYDGTLKLHGCKTLLWHRRPMDETKIQMLEESQRTFPFAPTTTTKTTTTTTTTLSQNKAVDVSAYCRPTTTTTTTKAKERQQCASALKRALQDNDGFALIRGTGLDPSPTLEYTQAFLQNAPEDIRRSAMAVDRARRGYSPMNTENFASLAGLVGRNDLVRKFRVGPEVDDKNHALHQPNQWPVNFDDEGRQAVESYYRHACMVAEQILRAICDGIGLDFEFDVDVGSDTNSGTTSAVPPNCLHHSSILTLLAYRKGSRHKGKHDRPLVAAHKDVGMLTLLVFDGGPNSCAVLQRHTANQWIDVGLEETEFVVNVGDCLSDLSGGMLKSGIHRVMPRRVPTERNAAALFLGLDPRTVLQFPGQESMTYGEWRQRRIAKAQAILKGKGEEPDIHTNTTIP